MRSTCSLKSVPVGLRVEVPAGGEKSLARAVPDRVNVHRVHPGVSPLANTWIQTPPPGRSCLRIARPTTFPAASRSSADADGSCAPTVSALTATVSDKATITTNLLIAFPLSPDSALLSQTAGS